MLQPLEEEDPDRVGPFAIEARLGAGGVYVGHAADGTAAAVRVMPPGDPGFRRRFAEDVAALARVLGEHTAALIDADPEAERPWLATEFVAGPPLTEVVAERGALPIPEVLRLTAGVADALAALHAAGVVHRDLKPHNVLLASAGPRVVDVGVGRDADQPGDLPALGELITFLATGGTGPVPEALRALVTRCAAPDPADRPTAAEVRTLCEAALSGPPTPDRPADPTEDVHAQDTIDALPHAKIVGAAPVGDREPKGTAEAVGVPSPPDTPAPADASGQPATVRTRPAAGVHDIAGPALIDDTPAIATDPSAPDHDADRPNPNAGTPDTAELTPAASASGLVHPAAGPAPADATPDTATDPTAPRPAADRPNTRVGTSDTAEPTPAAGASALAQPADGPAPDNATNSPAPNRPTANRPDPHAGTADAGGSAPAGASVLAYPAVGPPANPLDLSAGIPNDAIVGPVVATGPVPPADGEHPLAYPSASPPANPLDLSAGIPSDAIVGPVPAPDTDPPAPTTPLAYPAVEPPDNPLDLSAGIPSDAIVGPVPAPDTENTAPVGADPLAYPAASPPANPLDLSAGIPSDAIVGPVPAPDTPAPSGPPAYAGNPIEAGPVSAPDTDPAGPVPAPRAEPDVAAIGRMETIPAPRGPDEQHPGEPLRGAPHPDEPHQGRPHQGGRLLREPHLDEPQLGEPHPDEPHVGEPAGHVIEPIDYSTTPPRGFFMPRRRANHPARHRRGASQSRHRKAPSHRRRLAGLAAAIVLAVIALPLVRDDAIPGEPIAAPATSATPAAEDAVPGAPPGPNCAGSKDLSASGSSFQRDAMLTVADGWAARCPGSAVDYTPGGTALGLRQFGSGDADFAVTDHPLGEAQGEIAIAAARCAGTGAAADKDLVFESPMVLTPIVLAYRLPGIPGLRLDAPTAAAVFDGRVTAWNDKAIVKLNPGVRLPATMITVLSRSGEAQSTQTFQQYLTAVGGWRKGDGPQFAGGPSLAMASDLMIMAAIRDIVGAVAYLPYSVTRPTDEPVAMIVTGNGKAAIPGSDAVHAAVTAALHATEDLALLPDAIFHAGADQVGDGTAPYPLVHVGYVVACTSYPDDARAAAIRDFLLVALGTRAGPASGYQLPSGDLRDRLVDFVERTY